MNFSSILFFKNFIVFILFKFYNMDSKFAIFNSVILIGHKYQIKWFPVPPFFVLKTKNMRIYKTIQYKWISNKNKKDLINEKIKTNIFINQQKGINKK